MAYELSQYTDGVLVDTDVLISYTDVESILQMATDPDMQEIDGMPDMLVLHCADRDTWLYTTELFLTNGEWFEITWTGPGTTMKQVTHNHKENN